MSEQPATVGPPVVVVPDGWDATEVQGLVVVGVSASAVAYDAIGYAFEAAVQRGAELILVHVLPDGTADQSWYPAARRLVTEALDGWPEKYPEVTFRTHYRPGDPTDVLVGYSRVADLVVVGEAPKHLLERTRCPIAFVGGH
jgi:nucleotide-binding universal stress UspA family protein